MFQVCSPVKLVQLWRIDVICTKKEVWFVPLRRIFFVSPIKNTDCFYFSGDPCAGQVRGREKEEGSGSEDRADKERG